MNGTARGSSGPLRFTGLVLVGGASTRMGTDKAVLVPGDGGPPLVERARLALADAGAQSILAVGAMAPDRLGPGFTHVADRTADQGPLEGLVTGLRASPTSMVVVLTCDMPAIDVATVSALLDALAEHPDADAAMPVVDGRRQVLTAAYRVASADELDRSLRAGERSVRRALAGLVVVEVDEASTPLVWSIWTDPPMSTTTLARTVNGRPGGSDRRVRGDDSLLARGGELM